MSTQETKLKEIADAIRFQDGTTATIPANNFATRIRNIPSKKQSWHQILDSRQLVSTASYFDIPIDTVSIRIEMYLMDDLGRGPFYLEFKAPNFTGQIISLTPISALNKSHTTYIHNEATLSSAWKNSLWAYIHYPTNGIIASRIGEYGIQSGRWWCRISSNDTMDTSQMEYRAFVDAFY